MEQSPYMDAYVLQDYETVSPAIVEAYEKGGQLGDVKGIAYRSREETKNNPTFSTPEGL